MKQRHNELRMYLLLVGVTLMVIATIVDTFARTVYNITRYICNKEAVLKYQESEVVNRNGIN